jgi:hypothetical protein
LSKRTEGPRHFHRPARPAGPARDARPAGGLDIGALDVVSMEGPGWSGMVANFV